MTDHDQPIRILMHSSVAARMARSMDRRRFFGVTGGAALAAFLAACGGDDSGSSATTVAGGSGSSADFERRLNLFTWAEYDDPDLLDSWGNVNITVFNSNEEAIQRLASAGGSSGFDLVCPTGVYIPQMVAEGLLEALDVSRIANIANIDEVYLNQVWDQGNRYSVPKAWGTTGWIYDTEVVTSEILTWSDFIRVAQTEASGSTSVLDAAPDLVGIYFWANGIDWTTEDPADLDACEEFLVNELAPHIKAFDSFPGINLASGNYALSQIWNGDARQGLVAIEDSGGDPSRYRWAVGAPTTEIWMDNWCIVKGASNVEAAYDYINFILDPANSAQDVEWHGYNTGVKGLEENLPDDLPFRELVFFTDEELARMEGGAVNSAQDRLVEIDNNVKAAAAS